jgi:hypothetical protein
MRKKGWGIEDKEVSFARKTRRCRACLVHNHVLPNQNVTNHKSVVATKSVAEKFEAKLSLKLAKIITL